MRSVCLGLISLLAAAWLLACAAKEEPPPRVRAGLADLLSEQEPPPELPVPPAVVAEQPMTEEEIWSQAAIDLEKILAAAAAPTEDDSIVAVAPRPGPGAGPVESTGDEAPSADSSLSALAMDAAPEPDDRRSGWLLARALDPAKHMVAGTIPTISALASVLDPDRNPELSRALEAPVDPSARADMAATDLAIALRELAPGEDGFRARLVLAVLESTGLIAPVAAEPAPTTLEHSTALEAVAGLVRSLTADGGASAALLERFQEAADAVGSEQLLRITYATVCRRVQGFGRYTPFENDRFIAGRPQKMIVYVEVDRFAHRAIAESTTGDRWSVDLEQTLILHDEGGAIAWQVPAQEVREASRSRRHDFYLIHEIELPTRLAPGSYRLKVVMRDLVADAHAEAVIPIRLVAAAR